MKRALKYIVVSIVALGLFIVLPAFISPPATERPSILIKQDYLEELTSFHQAIKESASKVSELSQAKNQEELRKSFLELRTAFKKVEPIMGHLTDEFYWLQVNGAPLPKLDPQAENEVATKEPVGIQILDELIFSEEIAENETDIQDLFKKLDIEVGIYYKFQRYRMKVTDRRVFEACRSQMIRIMSLGISGFDTPLSGNALPDALVSFSKVNQYMQIYLEAVEKLNLNLATELNGKLLGGIEYLKANQDFDSFDRMHFIRTYLDPLYGLMLDAQLTLRIETRYEVSQHILPVNYMNKRLFSTDLFHPEYYSSYYSGIPNKEREELGELLFFDPALSKSGERSCASCHKPEMAFTDGEKKSIATDFKGTVKRNSPTLINSVYADRYFHDLATQKLDKQMDHVVISAKEFQTSYVGIVKRLDKSEEYRELFAKAFPDYPANNKLNRSSLNAALAAYVRSLSSFNSPFDQYMRGESEEIDPAVKRGFNIFMGKAACGTCHFAPVFNGTVPPDFKESESEVLGVPAEPIWENAVVDPDLGRIKNGRALEEGAHIFKYAFKTPTVRNIELTAPYMHNGVYKTLEEVMKFYNIGGGSGMGIDLPNQTLPFDNLNLTEAEIADVIAFMNSLTDAKRFNSQPKSLPEFPEEMGLNDRKIGGDY
ncbi:MAG: cytochrome c peroxidase [Bacteroidota bacterium]